MSESKQSSFLNTPVRRFEVYFLVGISFIIVLFTGIMKQSQDIRSNAADTDDSETTQNTLNIVGYVYVDENRNGERDKDEKPFPKAKIVVAQSVSQPTATPPVVIDGVVTNLMTDRFGYFKYQTLSSYVPNGANYTVQLELPPNFMSTSKNPIIYNNIGKRAKKIVEFGIVYKGTISLVPTLDITEAPAEYILSGTVFLDSNENGVRDTDETPVGSIPVTIKQYGKTIGTHTTDVRGGYNQIVGEGSYTVSIQIPGNRHLTTEHPVTVTVDSNKVVDFGIMTNPR